ncbi:MAG: hypothetical protein AAF197_13650 [Pseudomonadota bacterium]
MPDNIDRFNKYAAHFFAKLYERFPEPCVLDTVEAVTGSALSEPVHQKTLQDATTNPEVQFCCDALKWLHDTGYFKGDATLHYVQVSGAVLTPKGFEALNAVPETLQQTSLGTRLSQVAGEGAKEVSKAAIGELVGQVIGVATKGFLQG